MMPNLPTINYLVNDMNKFAIFIFIFMIDPGSGFCAEPETSLSISQKLAALDAEKLSKKALLDKYPDEFRNLTCVLTRELDNEYFISCGEYGEVHAPGREYLVVFNKTSGKLSIIQGQ